MAVVVQARQSLANGFPFINFVSFFTIQSNLFAAAVLLWTAVSAVGPQPQKHRELMRGAAVFYLSITGVVYGVLLAGHQEELHVTHPWVDAVLHEILPIAMAIDWLVEPPAPPLGFRDGILWLLYPEAYLSYTLVRGPWVAWYPYPFLDPAQSGGYAAVMLYTVGILIFSIFLALLIILIGRRPRRTVT